MNDSRKAQIDIAIPEDTGYPINEQGTAIEMCRDCPKGYEGYSCEECSQVIYQNCRPIWRHFTSKYHFIFFISIVYHLFQGYYRDLNDKQTVSLGACKRCQCSGHESDCFQVSGIISSHLEINLIIWLFIV